jgi:hypothetical protein
MHVPEADLHPMLSRENLQQFLKISRENSFLKEKLNLYLEKPEISATRVPSPPIDKKGSRIRDTSDRLTPPSLPLNERYRRLKIGPSPSRADVLPYISRNTAMMLVLHEIKRLSSSFSQVKQTQDTLRAQVMKLLMLIFPGKALISKKRVKYTIVGRRNTAK